MTGQQGRKQAGKDARMTEQQVLERRRWFGLMLLCMAQFVVVLDASIVNVALPSIGQRARLLPEQPRLGRERLRPDLRRVPAARRAAWPTCSAAGACSWRGLVLFALASLAGGFAQIRGPADRGARRAGTRRGDPLPGRAVDRDDDVPRRRRAQQGARGLGRGRRQRRRGRRAARRRADRHARLGVGAVGQRADRDRGGRDRADA